MIKREFSIYDYNSIHDGPEIIRSKWNIIRWGGDHGLGVRLINHKRYERFQLSKHNINFIIMTTTRLKSILLSTTQHGKALPAMSICK